MGWAAGQQGQQGQHRCLTLCLAVALRVFYISQVKIIIKRKKERGTEEKNNDKENCKYILPFFFLKGHGTWACKMHKKDTHILLKSKTKRVCSTVKTI